MRPLERARRHDKRLISLNDDDETRTLLMDTMVDFGMVSTLSQTSNGPLEHTDLLSIVQKA